MSISVQWRLAAFARPSNGPARSALGATRYLLCLVVVDFILILCEAKVVRHLHALTSCPTQGPHLSGKGQELPLLE